MNDDAVPLRNMDSSADECELGATVLADLPPLPEPDIDTMRSEASGGCSLVLCLIGAFVTVTVVFSLPIADYSTRLTLLSLISAEATVALCCLAGLLLGDPGVVRRSPQACLPMPAEVAARLAAAAPQRDEVCEMSGMSNIRDGDRSYCVRCFLWRDHAEPAGNACDAACAECGDEAPGVCVHHCSTCQRCVKHFDHHCGVFGRCIAGKGLEGNYKWFMLIILMAPAGAVTAVAAVIIGSEGSF